MNIRKLVSKTVSCYKNNGFMCTAKRIWSSLNPFVYRKMIMRHKQMVLPDSAPVDNLNICIASKKDINEEYQDLWYTREEALERLDKGHILFLAKDKGVNVFYGWYELSNISTFWLGIKNLDIPPDVVYLSAVYVPPQYGGRLILKRALKFTEKYLLDNTTVDKVFGLTLPSNIISSRLFDLFGYAPYQQVRYFRIMGLKLYIVESLENKKLKRRKIFIQSSNFWNIYSSILKSN